MQNSEIYIRMEMQIANWKNMNRFRSLAHVADSQIDFVSNDFLGLKSHPYIIKHTSESIRKNGVGSGGSRLLSGNSRIHTELEKRIATYHNSESALLFSSGFDANLGLISSIPNRTDLIIYDQYIHASVREGLRISHARSLSFRHNDTIELERLLSLHNCQKFLIVESVYSMGGNLAPLMQISELCKKYSAALIVDEAHAAGLIGPEGKGLVCELGIENEVFARIVTYGKAFGSSGAAVLGSDMLSTFLVNCCRSFIYTTAPSIPVVSSILAAYDLMPDLDSERSHVLELAKHFAHELQAISDSVKVWGGDSAIVSFVLGEHAIILAKYLQDQGYDVRAILSPTVPNGSELIRICFHSFNTKHEVNMAIQLITHFLSHIS